MNTFYDETLYGLKTESLKKIAEKEGAMQEIATVDTIVFLVAGEKITDERLAYILAIELKRRRKMRKGGAKC